MLNSIVQDALYSLRWMRRHRVFAIVAVTTIAIGIAANTTVFSLVNTMLRQPPDHIRDPETLYVVYLDEAGTPDVDYRGISYPQYDAVRRSQQVFTDLSFQVRTSPLATFGEETEPLVLDAITGNYFEIQGVVAHLGRMLSRDDDRSNSLIINEFLAQQMWPGELPLGKTIRVRNSSTDAVRQVVGVVPQSNCYDHLGEPYPCVYIPPPAVGLGTLILRASSFIGLPATIRETLRQVSPKAFVYDMRPLTEILEAKTADSRLVAFTTGSMAILGVLLSAIGCFAVFSSMISASMREIAIRMALGATPGKLARNILLRAVILSFAGIAAGAGASLFIARRLSDQFYRTNPADPIGWLSVGILITGIAIVATYLPVRKATRADPSAALKVL